MDKTTIFLVDESVDINILKSKINEYNNAKVISFDYYTHKSLEDKQISHDKVEDYLNENDCNNIDTQVMSFSTNWYKHPDLKKYLEYKNLNLGSLIELELPIYLIKIVKAFVGIIRIIEKDKPTRVVTSELLFSMVKSISGNKIEFINLEKSNKDIPSLVFDTIDVRFNLGKQHFSIHISRKTFLKLKKLAEKLVKFLFNLKINLNSSLHDAILLLEFNPTAYEDLLQELSKSNNKIILLNQRKPAITNMKSVGIVKKSNSQILLLEDLMNTDVKKIISDNSDALRVKLDEMFKSENLFHKIFSVDGYSLWNAIKDSFANICYNRFIENIYKIELAAELFKKIQFKCILEWTHTSAEEKVIIFEAKKYDTPIITLQHGLMTLNPVFDKYRPVMPYSPSAGTKMAIWGELMRNYNISHGINENQLLVSGSPRHDVFFRRKKDMKKLKDLILITGTTFVEINSNGNDTNSYVKFEEIIRTICKTASQIQDKQLVVKMHPAPTYFDVKNIIQTSEPSIPIYQDKSLVELLERSAVVIALNYSTTLLEAMILDVPTITVIVENQGYEEEFPIKNGATICVKNTEDFEHVLNDVLYNEEVRKDLISKGRQFVDICLSNQGSASKFLADIMSKL